MELEDMASRTELLAEMGEVVFDHTKRQPMCVVFPAYGRAEYLLGNLELIKRQTYVPDILVIGGEKTEEVLAALSKSGLPILAFRRKPRYFGPAGGFYVGERLALLRGYEKIVLGDEDAYLHENDTLAAIRDALDEHELAMIREDLSGGPAGMHHFAGIRRDAMLQVGFSYYPAYACFEDGEYERRYARKGFAPFVLDRRRSHPMKETGLMFGWLLIRNNLKHYLYQEPHLGHYLKTALRAEAMERILRQGGEAENADAMREAMREGMSPRQHAMPDTGGWKKLQCEQTPLPAGLRCMSVGGSYEAVGADREKLKDAVQINVPENGGLSSMAAPLRAAYDRDVLVFGHNLLWLGFFARSLRMYNPVGGAYYHAKNTPLQLAKNVLVVAGLLAYHTLFFLARARREPALAIGRFGMDGLEGLEGAPPAQSPSSP